MSHQMSIISQASDDSLDEHRMRIRCSSDAQQIQAPKLDPHIVNTQFITLNAHQMLIRYEQENRMT